MLRNLSLSFFCLVALAACGPTAVAEFWRPISEPNLQMSLEQAQKKLEFDMGQCNCGIFPKNVPQTDLVVYQPDDQRMIQTSTFFTKNNAGNCIQRPSLVVSECMRGRGWEVTKCSGRISAGTGGSICAAVSIDEDE